jgi:hypothetical protein
LAEISGEMTESAESVAGCIFPKEKFVVHTRYPGGPTLCLSVWWNRTTRTVEHGLSEKRELKMIAKAAVGIIVICAIVVSIVAMRGRQPHARELTPGEAKIRGFVREVYANNITSEDVTFPEGDAVLTVSLHDAKLAKMDVNLSSLARKQEDEGLTDAVVKLGLKF